MSILNDLSGPMDLSSFDNAQLSELGEEIRQFLIASVCSTGGHLGPNLGVVELTIALHRVFDSPLTPIVFDTGHQAYVHKLLTGRRAGFPSLRTAGGLSGYPSRAESVHDVIENSHASTALSYADGLSKAFEHAGSDRTVVAVVGDGALTGGLAWEALNNLGVSTRPVIVVLNDNGRSYAPTAGGLARHLKRLQDRSGYAAVVELLGGTAVPAAAGVDSIFTALGLDYLGPVDGHDIAAVESVLNEARGRRVPVVVHCLTSKGRGYAPAENDAVDKLHAVGIVDVATGRTPRSAHTTHTPVLTWTDAFADGLLSAGEVFPELVAISAAMLDPTGLQRFADRFPDRCFDVGIAEQHAITSAAGLAMGGAHPVVALYATFANRAFDQLLLDVGLHRLPVTLCLDRAGITGPDGPSHHGIWDLSMLASIPGMRVAAPRDAQSLAEELHEAVGYADGPTALRYPKSALGPPIRAVQQWDGMDVLRTADQATVLIVAVGSTAQAALAAAGTLAEGGVECTVVDPRWVLPVNPSIVDLADRHLLVVTVEDGIRSGGVGSHVRHALSAAGTSVPVTNVALPTEYVPHGSRAELLAHYGLDAAGITGAVLAAVRGINSGASGPVRAGLGMSGLDAAERSGSGVSGSGLSGRGLGAAARDGGGTGGGTRNSPALRPLQRSQRTR
ncbi:1-deoxy-D-xylulose-5-phosphate synthase [Paeniglutamicibacter antarcticus]|uniref:1-deoxy-D-xylulose-5-phosphate synthase n=1 Tax=Arthrobacter terrae TaxID=2935737 RepID=A0A931G6G1_9MICC|nr:1-deoxy-D-xylulose-5-phosphate synthase [Arthrobacter terrae]MBG0740620.1 1-deoxy-D-xylulose-5-phosphate synthase [Arthrobacter terrae]